MTLFLHIGMQKTGEDVLATIYGTSGGDLIAAGLNNDRVEATGGHDRVWGGSGNDTVLGGDGHDTVSGGNGADSLLGDNGNDLIQGGLGNDTLNGGGGVDTLLFTGTTAVRVSLDVTTGQATGYGTDVVSNFENVTGGNGADSLSGNAVANVLIGNGGADTLRGGSGADILTGGAGRDLLYGGGGADRDVFVFSATTETAAGTATRDLVYNFVSGQDDLDLRGIDANSAASGDQAFTFNGKIAKANAIWFVVSGTDVIVRGDVNGNTTADFEIQLSGVSALAAADFLL